MSNCLEFPIEDFDRLRGVHVGIDWKRRWKLLTVMPRGPRRPRTALLSATSALIVSPRTARRRPSPAQPCP